jgi:hypothetical protein
MHILDTFCAPQLGAVLAMSEDIAKADLLQWARAELPAYQVRGPTCYAQSAAYVLAFLQLATVCTLQMDSEQRVWAPQMPQVLHFVEAIPRNAMGKVNKKALLKDVFMRD